MEKLQRLYELDIYPYGDKFNWTHYAKDIMANYDSLKDSNVAVAGRIMAKRDHGKTIFLTLRDTTGDIQIFARIDEVSELENSLLDLLDVGDIIGVNGTVFKTDKGEISVRTTHVEMLTKSLRPLPDKWHGLKNAEFKYRHRYVDIIMNPQVREVFKKRAQIIATIREWLLQRNFMEVETPMMQNLYGGAVARPFITHHNAHDMDVYLRISPELYLKRLVVGGFDRVFEINRNFRNEGIDKSHYPEFTMVETYQAYADYNDMIQQLEDLVGHCAKVITGGTKIMYQGVPIEFNKPWQRMTMVEAIKNYSGEDFDEVETLDDARALADRLHAEYAEHDGIGKIMNACFETVAEGNLIQPTIITGLPMEISPLAKQSREKPWLTDRFEAYIFGRELANGFSELNDPFDQRRRFEQQMRERELGDEAAHQMDEDFVNALEYGLPPTAGLGIGIDRLVMFLTDSASIRDVIFFPLMKPEEGRERDLDE
ncbi:MAG: lysine--tRNA ligase [Veillonella caviae]|nr:lysine--tRNA ligase [Veillonella caviae]